MANHSAFLVLFMQTGSQILHVQADIRQLETHAYSNPLSTGSEILHFEGSHFGKTGPRFKRPFPVCWLSIPPFLPRTHR